MQAEPTIEDSVCYWCDGCGQFHTPTIHTDPRYRNCPKTLDYWIARIKEHEYNKPTIKLVVR